MVTGNVNIAQLRSRAGRTNVWLPALLLFFLPLSTSAISIVAVLIALLWVIEGNFSEKFLEIFSNPVSLAVLSFLALLLLGILWSSDAAAGVEVLEKRWKIAMLPIFLTAIRRESRELYVYAFLAGLFVAMTVTYLAWFDLIHYADVSPVHLTKKTFHVVYNPLLAFGIYLVFHEAFLQGRSAGRCIFFIFLGLVMTLDMFITEGRTGQLVFFVLMALLVLQIFPHNRLKAFVVLSVLLPAVFIAGYLFSSVFKHRVDTACQEISQFEVNPDTSVGLRLLFWENSWEILCRHPWLGTGTGGFQGAYAEVNSRNSPGSVVTDNPHNQYILITTMLGIPGLLALVLIFIVMFRQAFVMKDRWQRVRCAFPLFFLTIMLTESYLKVYETGFFFAVFAAVLYREIPEQRLDALRSGRGRCWLILSYRANIEGSACSQHLDDRLPYFREQGIEPVLLTGPVGETSSRWIHFKSHSLAPSGIRFEVRHFLRRHLVKKWQFKIVETLLLLPVFPLYLLEKILINLESEWSWWFLASLRGYFLCLRLHPEVIYSTGGSASSHVAALLINRWTGIRWLAETQDPLVHDHDWQRSRMVLKVYTLLEKKICARADSFIFLVRAAREHARKRVQENCRASVIYPGAVPDFFQEGLYTKKEKCHFAHFGSLAGTRNLVVFFEGLQQVFADNNAFREQVQVDIYGSLDGASERTMRSLGLANLVICHGLVPRKEAIRAMQQADCLLLIQNIIYFSCETIPSKVYEYLLSGRPILGMLYHNEELKTMLVENEHQVVSADDADAVARAINNFMHTFAVSSFSSKPGRRIWTVPDAVEKLCALSRGNNTL